MDTVALKCNKQRREEKDNNQSVFDRNRNSRHAVLE